MKSMFGSYLAGAMSVLGIWIVYDNKMKIDKVVKDMKNKIDQMLQQMNEKNKNESNSCNDVKKDCCCTNE